MPDNRIRVFVTLGFFQQGETDDHVYGTCPFCLKEKKFYISTETLKWDCKGGDCLRHGNLYSFLQQYYEMCRDYGPIEDYPDEWHSLEVDRKLPASLMWQCGVAYSSNLRRYIIPHRNSDGAIVTFRTYKPGQPLMALPGLDLQLINYTALSKAKPDDDRPVYICEGEWDCIALTGILQQSNHEGVVVGVPGAGTFKDTWLAGFKGRSVTILSDADDAGDTMRERICTKLNGSTKETRYIEWPDHTPSGFDIRDVYSLGPTLAILFTYLRKFSSEGGHSSAERNGTGKSGDVHARGTHPPFEGQQRPAFETVLKTYKSLLNVDQDYETGIRIAYATYLSQSMSDSPLWVYLVGPPSSGKTVLIESMAQCEGTLSASTLTPRVLVSGWRADPDPSLMSRLADKVFLMKDFTEVLNLPKVERDEIYSILRGAYDGVVEKSFGNGVFRYYEPHFSFLAGVTQDIYAERSASLGERFLMYHMLKGTNFDTDTTIMAALSTRGKLSEERRIQLAQAARDYLEVPFSPEDYDAAESSSDNTFHKKLAGLAQLVAMLRGQVRRDASSNGLLYRPQFEVGARLAKQLNKLAMALALLEDPIEINARVYRIITRVAFDTCIGFNLEVIAALAVKSPLYIEDLVEITGIAPSTLRVHIADMLELGVIERQKAGTEGSVGMPKYEYRMTPKLKQHWEAADFDNEVAAKVRPDGYFKR